MDLSQYAELFLAESREHLSACNQLLLDWERTPANPAPVAGLFRARPPPKGLAATPGRRRARARRRAVGGGTGGRARRGGGRGRSRERGRGARASPPGPRST